MNREKSCGTIIINRDKVLMIGARDKDGELFWSFPKGHQEVGETDIETALRETREEVGLEVEVINQNPIIANHLIHDGTVTKDIYLFLARITGGELKPQLNEVESVKWIDFNKVEKYLSDYYKTAWEEAKSMLVAQ